MYTMVGSMPLEGSISMYQRIRSFHSLVPMVQGKSTTLRTIMGLVESSKGEILYGGKDISKLKTKDIVEQGIVLVPEGRRIFPDLTVKENLILGAYWRKDKNEINRDIHWVYELFPTKGEGVAEGRHHVRGRTANASCWALSNDQTKDYDDG